MSKHYTDAVAEGFVHMSNNTFNSLFDKKSNRDNIVNKIEVLCIKLKNSDDKCEGFSHITDLKIDCEFNNVCVHGHRKCCIRIIVDVKTDTCAAEKAALFVVQKAALHITSYILDTDMEVQIHRIRLLSAKRKNGDSWIRPDNFDPKKGPRIHGC